MCVIIEIIAIVIGKRVIGRCAGDIIIANFQRNG